jgi:Arc/MetJ-type ribon-helix-helix transcriptional regulator
MQVHISDDAAAEVERLVRHGAYEDAQRVVEEAIRRLAMTDSEYDAALRAKILEGIASLDDHGGTEWTPDLADRIKREGRALRDSRKRPHE